MKYEQKNQVVQLRKNGMSLRDIAKIVPVSRSTISKWTKEVSLTTEQINHLNSSNPIYNNQMRGAQMMKEKHLGLRKRWQEEGKKMPMTITNDVLFIIGCTLFWTEGAKNRNGLLFSNTNVEMMKLWMRFLRECLHVQNADISINIQCHGDKTEKIESYWLQELKLPRTSLRKTSVVKNHPRSKNYRKNKHPFGVCRVVVNSTELAQKIFGAIMAIGSFNIDLCLI